MVLNTGVQQMQDVLLKPNPLPHPHPLCPLLPCFV